MSKNTLRIAQALTYLGLVPFMFLSIAVVTKFTGYDFDLALRIYGAIIISFLCGIHWGIYLLVSGGYSRNLFIYSNVITLVVYGSFLFGLPSITLLIQSLCLSFLLRLDYELMKKHIIPLWYFSLRRNATLAVVLILISTACLS